MVFLTLRDKLADESVPVTRPARRARRRAHAPGRGCATSSSRQALVLRQPRAASPAVREIRWSARASPRPPRAATAAAGREGLFAAGAEATAAVPPRATSVWSPPRAPLPSATCWSNAQQRWPASLSRVRDAAMQGITAGGEVIEAVAALDRDPDVDVIVVARGGGSVEDLLPFSDEAPDPRCRTP